MISIVLKDGRVLKYNEAEDVVKNEELLRIVDKQGLWIAQIPLEVIERVESYKPCRILKEYKKKNYARY